MANAPFFGRSRPQAGKRDKKNPKCLTLVREPREDKPVCMEVVLLHGLMGKSYDTWKWDSSLPWNQYFWPDASFDKDPKLQLARVWTFGYNAAVFSRLFERPRAGISDFAYNLLFELKCMSADENVSGIEPLSHMIEPGINVTA